MQEKRYIKKLAPGFLLLALLSYSSGVLQAEEKKEVLATVGDKTITEADIAEDIAGQMVRINNQIYSIKKQAVDARVSDYLIDQEAKKRGISRDQLLQQEVNAKTPPVTDAEIEQIYNANKARLGNKTLEEMKPQIEQQLKSNKQQQQQQTFVQDLRKAATVKMVLKPPVLNVDTADAPTRGPASAPVMIVEFSDFQ